MTVPDHKIGADVWGRAGDSKPQTFPEDDLPSGDRPINTFLDALTRAGCSWKAHPSDPTKWKAQCPAHSDRNPSLDIKEGADGRVLITCWSAQCPREQIIDRLGLQWPDLFPSNGRKPKAKNNGKPQDVDWIAELKRLGLVEPGHLLDQIIAFIRRYVVLTSTQATAIALWVLHTHAFDVAEASPYLAVLSPEKRCGKTLLLRVLSLLVRDPWRVISPSESVVYRKIEQDRPTLLLDEIDAIFSNGKDYEGLRAILNAGNEPDTHVPRCDGPNRDKLREFAVFCPKVLAGIGKLPETVDDRSIRILMKRKSSGEVVERFRRREAQEQVDPLRSFLSEWAASHHDDLEQARPELPDELDDRAADGWEPLLAIADLAGGGWPERSREAARELSANGDTDDDSVGIRLLGDIETVFDGGRLSTTELLERLNALEESPWGDWYGKPLSARVLARLLKPFQIKTRTIRLTEDKTARGYLREQFEDAWSRYIPHLSDTSDTLALPSQKQGVLEVTQDAVVSDSKEAANPHHKRDVSDVSDRAGGEGR
jgi:hypothetical protein